MKTRKTAKCPKCCPDGGAIFRKTYGISGWEWQCNNCGCVRPARKNKPTGRMTPSQKAVVAKLEAQGWTVETKIINNGPTWWVSATRDFGNPGQNLFLGTNVYGPIGPRGKFKLTLQRFGGEKVVTDSTGIYVYLSK